MLTFSAFIKDLSVIYTKAGAINILAKCYQQTSSQPLSESINKAIEHASNYHQGQYRKRVNPDDEPVEYIVHPISVAAIVAYLGGDEVMICSALLHDVVEDTLCELEDVRRDFGIEVANLVDGLTKIVEIRENKLEKTSSNDKQIESMKTFQKMIMRSVGDIRVLVIKMCDRMHNMLSLEVHRPDKQIRISKETLIVYVPLATRLGISSLKNELEDRSFYYIYPDEYKKIQSYITQESQNLDLRLNDFRDKVAKLMEQNGFAHGSYEIESRVKRFYSIYLKMQRKGISIDEILDLLAIRIIVKEPLDCYKTLGILHTHFQPIVSRLKDYVALPKENGYQTIHTSVFDKSSIYEVQIRTFDMNENAQYGVAAHWKYKDGGRTSHATPKLDWLEKIQKDAKEIKTIEQGTNKANQESKNQPITNEEWRENNELIEEFYELAKTDLYKEDVSVFSPKGEIINLPSGSIALDYAYAIHSDLGDRAKEVYINHQKSTLLTPLKIGDIVEIRKASEDEKVSPRYTWLDAVKSSRAKSALRTYYQNKRKEIEKKAAINILATIFDRNSEFIGHCIYEMGLDAAIHRASREISYLREIKGRLKIGYNLESFLNKIKITTLNLKIQKFDNVILHTNRNINNVIFDYCCHPKLGDEILALKYNQKAYVHHKFCDKAIEQVINGQNMLFVEWVEIQKDVYKIIVALENRKGALASFLQVLAKYDNNVIKINYDGISNKFARVCEIFFETNLKDIKKLKETLSKKFHIIELSSQKDVYSK